MARIRRSDSVMAVINATSAARWPPRAEAVLTTILAFWAWTADRPTTGPEVVQAGIRVALGESMATMVARPNPPQPSAVAATAATVIPVSPIVARRAGGGTMRRAVALSVPGATVWS